MDDTRWDELDQLGRRLGVLKRLLDRAAEYGDHVQTQRVQAEIARSKSDATAFSPQSMRLQSRHRTFTVY
jgi:hypothetical protein